MRPKGVMRHIVAVLGLLAAVAGVTAAGATASQPEYQVRLGGQAQIVSGGQLNTCAGHVHVPRKRRPSLPSHHRVSGSGGICHSKGWAPVPHRWFGEPVEVKGFPFVSVRRSVLGFEPWPHEKWELVAGWPTDDAGPPACSARRLARTERYERARSRRHSVCS